MKKVVFLPRVKDKYEKTGWKGLKILVLGESHYGNNEIDKEKKKSITQEVFDCFMQYKSGKKEFFEHWMNTYTKFTNVLLNKSADYDELLNFWDSVIFYNYVQSFTSEPRSAPTKEQFKESEEAFFEVLNKYQPDLIIVWGMRLWENMSGKGDSQHNNDKLFNYPIDNQKSIPAYHIYHPSSSYFNFSCSKDIQNIIEEIANSKKK
ncbi:MAG TPA: uracil-DNA glycosylase family protein [Crocinitomicaceae bacterium]|nr:uracil-DNA glycosylase family protein [Crocinitomicaceae bacterium]